MHAKDTLRLYLHATLKHRKESLEALALPASTVILGVFVPFYASKLLADIVTHADRQWHDLVVFACLAGIGFLLNTYGIRKCMWLQAHVMDELHSSMFARLLDRSVGFYNNQVGGKLVSDALDFINAYGQLFNAAYIASLTFVLTTTVGLAVVFVSSWQIGLCISVLLAGLVYWSVLETGKRSGLRSQRLVISKQLTAHLADNIVNAVTVKMFAREGSETAENRRINALLADARAKDWQRSVTSESERMGVLLLMQLCLLVVLIWLTAHDPHTLTAGIFAFTYTLTLINRFFTINTLVRQIEEAFLQASPMTELLEESIEITDLPEAQPLVVRDGEIVCHDVRFQYADAPSEDYVFDGLNLHIKPGEKIGLVGHSGGGKSTLTRLLLRFDDISNGSITIDGQDIRSVTQVSLREQISYVPQEPLLFHRTIRENIAYGNEGVSREKVEKAAKLAYAHGFISKLPDQYDTIVGERGVKLSGGQRQRIAIARAILKDAPILILDEATSALDSESEKVIQNALWELMDGRTAVVVAHRLSTIQKMDRIIVLDDGKIVEEGTHKELVAKQKGVYAKLWAHQSGGFIEE